MCFGDIYVSIIYKYIYIFNTMRVTVFVCLCVCVFGIGCNPMRMALRYIIPCKSLPSSKWKAPQITSCSLAICYLGSGLQVSSVSSYFFSNLFLPFHFFLYNYHFSRVGCAEDKLSP